MWLVHPQHHRLATKGEFFCPCLFFLLLPLQFSNSSFMFPIKGWSMVLNLLQVFRITICMCSLLSIHAVRAFRYIAIISLSPSIQFHSNKHYRVAPRWCKTPHLLYIVLYTISLCPSLLLYVPLTSSVFFILYPYAVHCSTCSPRKFNVFQYISLYPLFLLLVPPCTSMFFTI